MKLREAAEMALHYFEDAHGLEDTEVAIKEALREALAEPEQEPVAWHEPGSFGNVTTHEKWAKENGWEPLYTAPPQKEWVGLTKEEAREISMANRPYVIDMIAALEAKLKEKNT